MRALSTFIDWIGKKSVNVCDNVGQATLFFAETIQAIIGSKPKGSRVLIQLEQLGLGSLFIAVVTGAFAGAGLAYQGYEGLHRFGGEGLLGAIIALSLTRELGPVLVGLMVGGRASAAIAAEIGTMRISEQLDAISLMGISPFQYLVVPTILGATLATPLLAIFAMMAGIIMAYLVCIYGLGLTPDLFIGGIRAHVDMFDVGVGLFKSAIFGLIFSWVGCYKGFYTSGGARGVGLATTQSVVISSLLIIMANYVLAIVLFSKT